MEIKPLKVETKKPEGKVEEIVIPRIRLDKKEDPARYFGKREPRRLPKRLRWAIMIAAALVILQVVQWFLMGVNGFFETRRLIIKPIIKIELNWPIEIKKRESSSQKSSSMPVNPIITETKAAEPRNTQQDRLIDFIWSTESGKGTAPAGWHVGCRVRGLWNEIGYGGPGYCFSSADEGLSKLKAEMTARIAKNGIVEALCVYNKGFNRDEAGNRIPYKDCEYYQNYVNYAQKWKTN